MSEKRFRRIDIFYEVGPIKGLLDSIRVFLLLNHWQLCGFQTCRDGVFFFLETVLCESLNIRSTISR